MIGTSDGGSRGMSRRKPTASRSSRFLRRSPVGAARMIALTRDGSVQASSSTVWQLSEWPRYAAGPSPMASAKTDTA